MVANILNTKCDTVTQLYIDYINHTGLPQAYHGKKWPSHWSDHQPTLQGAIHGRGAEGGIEEQRLPRLQLLKGWMFLPQFTLEETITDNIPYYTLPVTNIAPSQKEFSSSNHLFSAAMLVSGSVLTIPNTLPLNHFFGIGLRLSVVITVVVKKWNHNTWRAERRNPTCVAT